MTKLERSLYAHWVSRLGRKKVNELAAGMDAGKSVADKARALVNSSSEAELQDLLLEGFGGFFHQTIYLRSATKKATANRKALLEFPDDGDQIHSTVLAKVQESSNGRTAALLMVTESMEFLAKPPLNAPVLEDVPFPVVVHLYDSHICIHVLTMQSTVETWGEIVGEDLSRLLTFVKADGQYDHASNFLRELGVGFGEYVDYSKSAVKLIKRPDVNTYAGTLEVGTVGSSKYSTLRGKGKKGMRESMGEQFNRLVVAKRIIDAEVEIADDHLGLKAGSRIALYPAVGKIAFRSNLEGCNPDEFVSAMAEN